jgi:DNA-binding HxlR family transcriptional regulator
VRRYGELQRNLGIARNVLADRLRALVADGMFERVRYRTDPDWYEYRLTERALDLYPVIVGLMCWAHRHLATEDEAAALELIHRSCGEPAEPYLACSRCHEPLTARDIEARVRAAGGSPG